MIAIEEPEELAKYGLALGLLCQLNFLQEIFIIEKNCP
jgi:hypothetical protein